LRRLVVSVAAAGFVYLGIETGSHRNLQAGWLLFVIGSILAIVQGWRFRRGNRYMLPMYYSSALPAVARNLPLLGLPFGLLILPWLLAIGSLVAAASPTAWPHWAVSAVFWGSGAYLSFAIGLILVLAYRPPQWLMPAWLRDVNARGIQVPPPTDWFDRVGLAVGVFFLLGTLLFAYAGVLGVMGTRGL
jgi:hypothetical protein